MWLFIVLGLSLSLAKGQRDPTVVTNYGSLEGTKQTIFNGKEVDAFLGVPYAAPPTGINRFAAPKPPKPWNKTLKVKNLPVSCYQAAHDEVKKAIWFMSVSAESEDCLYLNVWRPKRRSEEKLTVMVWIPGGGYYSGSSNIPLYDGAILAAEQNVIVLSMNYRLSAFGFYYANTTDVHGNAGLQDQIASLKWVKENIKSFGGDPNKITIFGESSGSFSVGYHLTNLDTFDLFQYGIMESGSIDMPRLSLPMDAMLSRSKAFARDVGCPDDDADEMLTCLRAKPAELIMKPLLDIPPYFNFTFPPVRNGFEVPVDLQTAVQNVPVDKRKNLLGGNLPNECGSFIPSFFPDIPFGENFTVSEEDWTTFLVNNYQLRDPRLQSVLRHEYTNYYGNKDSDQLRIIASHTLTDMLMLCPQVKFTKGWTTGQNKVFYYEFNHRPSQYIRSPFPEWIGPTHGDEIAFVFGRPLNPKNGYTDVEVNIAKEVMTFWANFAKTGDPNDCNRTTWPALKPNQKMTVLEIGQTTRVKSFTREKKCGFWNDVYPNLISIQLKLDDKGLTLPVS